MPDHAAQAGEYGPWSAPEVEWLEEEHAMAPPSANIAAYAHELETFTGLPKTYFIFLDQGRSVFHRLTDQGISRDGMSFVVAPCEALGERQCFLSCDTPNFPSPEHGVLRYPCGCRAVAMAIPDAPDFDVKAAVAKAVEALQEAASRPQVE